MTSIKPISSRIAFGVAALGIALVCNHIPVRADFPDRDSDSVALHKRFEMLTKGVDGLTDDQKKKLDDAEKPAQEEIKNSLTKMHDPAFRDDCAARVKDVLTPDQQKTFEQNLEEARKLETRTATEQNLYDVGAAFEYFRAPVPDLGTLHNQQIEPQNFLVADSTTKVPADWKDMTPGARAAWVNKNTDFVYIGGSVDRAKITGDTVLAYVKPDVHPDENEFLMGDGTVKSETAEDSKKIIADLTAGKNPPPSLRKAG
jgi:hypothetical protein